MPVNRSVEKQKVSIYARALLDVAGDDANQLLEFDKELAEVVGAYHLSGELREAFDDPNITEEQRRLLAYTAFGDFENGIKQVMVVMAERGDIDLVPRVANEFTVLAEDKLGAVVVTVTTAVELDDHLRDVIKKKLSSDFGKSIILREHVDKTIIGGIIMSAHGKRIDASIASQLENSREVLSTSPIGGDR